MPSTARDPTTPRLFEKESWYIEVVEQAQAGDKLAFDTLFEYYNTGYVRTLPTLWGMKKRDEISLRKLLLRPGNQ